MPQRAFKVAVRHAGVQKNATVHSLKHSFATSHLEVGYDIWTVEELLSHANVSTTMVGTHVLNHGARGVRSPLDETWGWGEWDAAALERRGVGPARAMRPLDVRFPTAPHDQAATAFVLSAE
jgi:hypothetical protein